jgi:Sec-independent protein secretion pathway component TatC
MKQLVSNLKGDKGFGHLYLIIGLVFLMPVLALVVTWLILVKPEIH